MLLNKAVAVQEVRPVCTQGLAFFFWGGGVGGGRGTYFVTISFFPGVTGHVFEEGFCDKYGGQHTG